MVIYHGSRHYGAVDAYRGQRLVSRFAHIYLLPLFPLSTTWVIGENNGRYRGHDVAIAAQCGGRLCPHPGAHRGAGRGRDRVAGRVHRGRGGGGSVRLELVVALSARRAGSPAGRLSPGGLRQRV